MNKFLVLAMIIFSSFAVFAQEGFLAAPPKRSDFWVSPGAEMALFSPSSISVGGSLAVVYGSRFSIGFSAAWFFDMNSELDALEMNLLLRYFFVSAAEDSLYAGPYLQLTGGPVIFFDLKEDAPGLAHWGRISAGLTFGWRFLLGKLFFAEPYIRLGYPYIAGIGVSAGVHF